MDKRDVKKQKSESDNSGRRRTLFLRNLISGDSISTNNKYNKTIASNKDIINHLEIIESKIGKEKLSENIIHDAIHEMYKGSYGIIDLNNDQHLELLYWHVSHIAEQILEKSQYSSQELETSENEKWETEKLLSPDPENTYKIAFLGAGASVANEIESRLDFDPSKAIHIGTPEPWKSKRGPGVVVYPEHLITPMRQFVEKSEINDIWAERDHFAQLIENVFEASDIKRKTEQVKKIEKVSGFYRITYGDQEHNQFIYAKEVVAGMGIGEHTARGIEENQIARSVEDIFDKGKRIMDMDLYTQVAERLGKDIVVILSGGNGATGTAFDILKRDNKVEWIVGRNGANFLLGTPSDAAYLSYLKYLANTEKNTEQKQIYEQKIAEFEINDHLTKIYSIQDEKLFKNVPEIFKEKTFAGLHFTYLEGAEQNNDRVTVRMQNGKTLEGDILVYAMGQDLSTFGLFSEEILKNLISDPDRNFRFPRGDNTAEMTTLALKSKDNSLTIIGAAAYHLASRIDAQHSMEQVIKSLPDNIGFNDQLTPIRSQIEVSRNFVPYDTNKQVNFLADDWTILAVHISAKYPTIADYKLPAPAKGKEADTVSSAPLVGLLTEMIVRSRRQKSIKIERDGLSLNGPDVLAIAPNGREFQEAWEKALGDLEMFLKYKQGERD